MTNTLNPQLLSDYVELLKMAILTDDEQGIKSALVTMRQEIRHMGFVYDLTETCADITHNNGVYVRPAAVVASEELDSKIADELADNLTVSVSDLVGTVREEEDANGRGMEEKVEAMKKQAAHFYREFDRAVIKVRAL